MPEMSITWRRQRAREFAAHCCPEAMMNLDHFGIIPMSKMKPGATCGSPGTVADVRSQTTWIAYQTARRAQSVVSGKLSKNSPSHVSTNPVELPHVRRARTRKTVPTSISSGHVKIVGSASQYLNSLQPQRLRLVNTFALIASRTKSARIADHGCFSTSLTDFTGSSVDLAKKLEIPLGILKIANSSGSGMRHGGKRTRGRIHPINNGKDGPSGIVRPKSKSLFMNTMVVSSAHVAEKLSPFSSPLTTFTTMGISTEEKRRMRTLLDGSIATDCPMDSACFVTTATPVVLGTVVSVPTNRGANKRHSHITLALALHETAAD